jgi:hypothetical protein
MTKADNDNDIPFWIKKPPRYVPSTLSEIYDKLASVLGGAPLFQSDWDMDRNIDTEFDALFASFEKVRKKVGEDRYAALVDLATRAKALFAADPEENNGKTEQGLDLINEIEDIIQAARSRRVKQKLPDDEGEITGD